MPGSGWPLGNPHSWRPVVNNESPGQYSIAYDEFKVVEVVDIPTTQIDLPAAISTILGYPWVEFPAGGANTTAKTRPLLHRILPMAHPRFPWLFATKITSLQGRGPVAKLPPDARKSQPITAGFMEYQFWRANVLFEAPQWVVKSDADMQSIPLAAGGEFNRYVQVKHKYSVEVQTRRGNNFTYLIDNQAGAGQSQFPGQGGAGPANASIGDMGINLRIPKAAFIWSWKQVPETYIFKVPPTFSNGVTVQPGILRPSIDGCRGKVNQRGFAGFGPQTLLLNEVETDPEACPIDPRIWGYPDGTPARTYTVNLHVLYINPPIPNSRQFSDYGAAGHNLVPSPQGIFWGATRSTLAQQQANRNSALARGQLLYDTCDMSKIFNPDDTPPPRAQP